MKGKNFFTSLNSVFSGKFAFLASLASILGLIILILKDDWAIKIALMFFCLMLTVFTAYLIYTLYRILDIKQVDHENRSTFIKYETTDGNKITYETYKLLQSKKPVLTEFDYNFKWTGSIFPEVTSDFQEVINVVDEKNPNSYDKAILKFKRPLYYNQNTVLHFKAILDDVDKQSQPYVETKVKEEVDIIHYRIVLKNKPNNYNANAILEKRKIINETANGFEKIREISYDTVSKSYEYHLLNPEIGFFYRIRWEK